MIAAVAHSAGVVFCFCVLAVGYLSGLLSATHWDLSFEGFLLFVVQDQRGVRFEVEI